MNEKPKQNDAARITENLQRKQFLTNKNLTPNGQFQLDLLYPDHIGKRTDLRHIPNDLARSSLFTTRHRRTPRQNFQNTELFHFNNHISVTYTGIELRAEDDELVWLQILNYAQSVPLGDPFKFSIRQLINDLGWPINGGSYDRARASISRLKANEIMVKNTKAYGTSGALSLIANYKVVNEADGTPTYYEMLIDKALIYLFAGNTFTSHKWDIYKSLTPTARRLADQLESHKTPFPLSVTTFKNICASLDKTKKSWNATVRAACAEIVKKGLMEQVTVKDDFIYSIPKTAKLSDKQNQIDQE